MLPLFIKIFRQGLIFIRICKYLVNKKLFTNVVAILAIYHNIRILPPKYVFPPFKVGTYIWLSEKYNLLKLEIFSFLNKSILISSAWVVLGMGWILILGALFSLWMTRSWRTS
jgi:hypothetical protein